MIMDEYVQVKNFRQNNLTVLLIRRRNEVKLNISPSIYFCLFFLRSHLLTCPFSLTRRRMTSMGTCSRITMRSTNKKLGKKQSSVFRTDLSLFTYSDCNKKCVNKRLFTLLYWKLQPTYINLTSNYSYSKSTIKRIDLFKFIWDRNTI